MCKTEDRPQQERSLGMKFTPYSAIPHPDEFKAPEPTHFVLFNAGPPGTGGGDYGSMMGLVSRFDSPWKVIFAGAPVEAEKAAQKWVETHGGVVKISRVGHEVRATARIDLV